VIPVDTVGIRDKRVLVVGGGGFLGSAIVERLLGLGARVVGASRATRPADSTVEWHNADVSDAAAAAALVEVAKPQIIFHLASDSMGGRGIDLVPASLRNDVVATVNMLHATVTNAQRVERFVMTASLEEPTGTAREPTPVSPYAAAKWATGAYGRMFRHLYGLDVRIVRPMMAYGPGQKEYKLVPATILALLRGQATSIGSGARLVDFVYVDDVVDGMLAAALVPSLDTTVDIGSGGLVTIQSVAEQIARQLGRTELLRFGDAARGDEVVRAADADHARRHLGFMAKVALPDGITRTIAWYRERL